MCDQKRMENPEDTALDPSVSFLGFESQGKVLAAGSRIA
jgi:hypothetical protein